MELKLDLVALIGSIVGVVVWLIRLEGKVNMAEKSNNETQKDVDHLRTDFRNVFETLAAIREGLARIEGRLAAFSKEKKDQD